MNTVVVNDEYYFTLTEWNSKSFQDECKLNIKSDDFARIKHAFSKIKDLKFYEDGVFVASYTIFDSYSSISYVGKIYSSSLNEFAETITVLLTRQSIIEKIKKLDNTLNPIVDINEMSLDEYRKFKADEVSADCRQDIYAGKAIAFEDGTSGEFSFNAEDQSDIKALFDLASLNPTMSLSYHANGEECRFFSGAQIIQIYSELQMKLLQCTTKCNAINQIIKKAKTKEELAACSYNMELPDDSKKNVNNIISGMTIVYKNVLNTMHGKGV